MIYKLPHVINVIMRLKIYLKTNKITELKFANRVNVSQPFISQICNGNRRPSPELADLIEKATGGSVTFEELLRPKAA